GVFQGFLGTLPLGDVGDCAGHRGGLARGVELDDPKVGHPADTAVGPDDAELARIDLALIDRGIEVLENALAVGFVHKLPEGLDRSLETPRLHGMDRVLPWRIR